LTRDITKLAEGCDQDGLGGGRNRAVVQEGVGSGAGNPHIIHQEIAVHLAQLRRTFFAHRIGQSAGPIDGRECGAPTTDIARFTLKFPKNAGQAT
jgi:hypothetical protein